MYFRLLLASSDCCTINLVDTRAVCSIGNLEIVEVVNCARGWGFELFKKEVCFGDSSLETGKVCGQLFVLENRLFTRLPLASKLRGSKIVSSLREGDSSVSYSFEVVIDGFVLHCRTELLTEFSRFFDLVDFVDDSRKVQNLLNRRSLRIVHLQQGFKEVLHFEGEMSNQLEVFARNYLFRSH